MSFSNLAELFFVTFIIAKKLEIVAGPLVGHPCSIPSLLEGKTGMIVPEKSRQKQRVVIQFLLSEGETAQNRSGRLKQVYGDGAIDYSTVTRWVKRINDGQEKSSESDLCENQSQLIFKVQPVKLKLFLRQNIWEFYLITD